MLLIFGCNKQSSTENFLTTTSMQITSPAFTNNQNIPAKYTCDGDDVNPPLVISEVPDKTQSLALVVSDPDAPSGNWIHWLLWNLDPKTTIIAENTPATGAVEGTNSFGKKSFGGPCPPSGVHRYFFKLYALDTKLDLASTSRDKDFETAIVGHVLAKAELLGLYEHGSK